MIKDVIILNTEVFAPSLVQCFLRVRMVISPYKVFAIVDRNFGEKLLTLPERVPVRIVDTVVNKPVVNRLWQERSSSTRFSNLAAMTARILRGGSPKMIPAISSGMVPSTFPPKRASWPLS